MSEFGALELMRSAYFESGRLLQKIFCCALALIAVSTPSGIALARRHVDPNSLRNVPLAQPAPDFAFDTGSGIEHLRDLEGRPVVISFWATWCRPCQDELPAFVKLEQNYGDKVALITISSEDRDVVRGFLASQNIALPTVEDPQKQIFTKYSVDPIPVTLVLDAAGRTRYISVGELSWDELQTAVAATLGQPAAEQTEPSQQAK